MLRNSKLLTLRGLARKEKKKIMHTHIHVRMHTYTLDEAKWVPTSVPTSKLQHLHIYTYMRIYMYIHSWWAERNSSKPHVYFFLFAFLYLLGQSSLCKKKDSLIQEQVRCCRRGGYSRTTDYKFIAVVLAIL